MNCIPIKISKVELSEDALKLHQFLIDTYQWPNGSEVDLPFVLRKSWSNYSSLKDQQEKLRVGAPDKLLLIESILIENGLFKRPRAFLRDWFKWVNEQIVLYKDWSGKLENYIWEIDHSIYFSQVLKILSDHSISSNDWENFKSYIK